jgi:hypothetical protein
MVPLRWKHLTNPQLGGGSAARKQAGTPARLDGDAAAGGQAAAVWAGTREVRRIARITSMVPLRWKHLANARLGGDQAARPLPDKPRS